jgi:hypothetical protein
VKQFAARRDKTVAMSLIEEVRFASDSPLEGNGFELPVPLATERLSCRLDALGGVLFGELGFGLTNHQDREGDGCQHSEAE